MLRRGKSARCCRRCRVGKERPHAHAVHGAAYVRSGQTDHRTLFRGPLVHGAVVQPGVRVLHHFAEHEPCAGSEVAGIAVGDAGLASLDVQMLEDCLVLGVLES